jgi:hypothetical protein
MGQEDMKLTVTVDDKTSCIEVPEDMLVEGEEFFWKMDRDMDGGWRMGPEFIEKPDQVDRCRIAADKLLVSMSTENQTLGMLMAGYILKRLRGVSGVNIDTGGEMLNTEFTYHPDAPGAAPAGARPAAFAGDGRPKLAAMEQAAKDVSQVYKVGKGFRFAAYDHASGQWIESPLIPDEQAAQKARMHVYQQRLNELVDAQH